MRRYRSVWVVDQTLCLDDAMSVEHLVRVHVVTLLWLITRHAAWTHASPTDPGTCTISVSHLQVLRSKLRLMPGPCLSKATTTSKPGHLLSSSGPSLPLTSAACHPTN